MSAEWESLNERQRAYLRALYDCDQAEESARRAAAARGHWSRTPAREWRWQMYGPVAPPSALYEQLRQAKLIDPGTGATWQALEDRGLVLCRYTKDAMGVQLLEVQIMPKGRKVVRAATGEQRPKPLPKGTLRERQWAALVRLYKAGDAGEASDHLQYGPGGFDWYMTLRRLEEYTPEPLIKVSNGEWIDGFFHRHELRYRITSYGRAYYEREWARYRELYPNVEAPPPAM